MPMEPDSRLKPHLDTLVLPGRALFSLAIFSLGIETLSARTLLRTP